MLQCVLCYVQTGRAVESTDPGVRLWFCSSDLPVQPWASYLISLCLNFLICVILWNMKKLIWRGCILRKGSQSDDI